MVLEAAACVKPRSDLIGNRFVLDEAVCVPIESPPHRAAWRQDPDLRCEQAPPKPGCTCHGMFPTTLHPFPEPLQGLLNHLHHFEALLLSGGFVERRGRQRAVVVIIRLTGCVARRTKATPSPFRAARIAASYSARMYAVCNLRVQ